MHQEKNPTTVSQLLTQIQELQNKVNSLSDAREFDGPEPGGSSGAITRSRSNSELCWVPEPCRALRFWIAAWYTKLHGNCRTRFWTTTCSRKTILHSLQHIQKNLASSSQELRPDIAPKLQGRVRERAKWKESRSIRQIPLPPFPKWRVVCWIHTGGTHCSQWFDG